MLVGGKQPVFQLGAGHRSRPIDTGLGTIRDWTEARRNGTTERLVCVGVARHTDVVSKQVADDLGAKFSSAAPVVADAGLSKRQTVTPGQKCPQTGRGSRSALADRGGHVHS